MSNVLWTVGYRNRGMGYGDWAVMENNAVIAECVTKETAYQIVYNHNRCADTLKAFGGPMNKKKPNGEPFGTFMISIDDGYVEYKYRLGVRFKHASIDKVWQRIRKQFRARDTVGEIRTRH